MNKYVATIVITLTSSSYIASMQNLSISPLYQIKVPTSVLHDFTTANNRAYCALANGYVSEIELKSLEKNNNSDNSYDQYSGVGRAAGVLNDFATQIKANTDQLITCDDNINVFNKENSNKEVRCIQPIDLKNRFTAIEVDTKNIYTGTDMGNLAFYCPDTLTQTGSVSSSNSTINQLKVLDKNSANDTLAYSTMTQIGIVNIERETIVSSLTETELIALGRILFSNTYGGPLVGYMLDSGKTIKIWDSRTNKTTKTFSANNDLTTIALNDTGILLSAQEAEKSSSISIWDFVLGTCINTIPNAHKDIINSLEFIPDNNENRLVASGSFDGIIKIWSKAILNQITQSPTSVN